MNLVCIVSVSRCREMVDQNQNQDYFNDPRGETACGTAAPIQRPRICKKKIYINIKYIYKQEQPKTETKFKKCTFCWNMSIIYTV